MALTIRQHPDTSTVAPVDSKRTATVIGKLVPSSCADWSNFGGMVGEPRAITAGGYRPEIERYGPPSVGKNIREKIWTAGPSKYFLEKNSIQFFRWVVAHLTGS